MIYVFTDLKRMVTSNVSSATKAVIEKGNGPDMVFVLSKHRLLEAMQVCITSYLTALDCADL